MLEPTTSDLGKVSSQEASFIKWRTLGILSDKSLLKRIKQITPDPK